LKIVLRWMRQLKLSNIDIEKYLKTIQPNRTTSLERFKFTLSELSESELFETFMKIMKRFEITEFEEAWRFINALSTEELRSIVVLMGISK
jgi:hypothetical protein